MTQTLSRGLAVNMTAGELAALVGGTLRGDAAFKVETLTTLEDAGPRDLSFLGNPRYAQAAMESKAGVLLLPPMAADAPGLCQNRILVEDPQWAYAQVLLAIEARRPKTAAGVSAKAAVDASAQLGSGVSVGAFTVIEAGARIGEGCEIYPQVYIGRDVVVGKGCKLYPGVVIREDCVIGDRVILQPGVVVGGDGYGFSPDKKTGQLRKIPQLGNVVVCDDVEIQANTCIDRGALGATTIGAGTKIDNLVQIGHNVQIGRDCLLVSQVGIAGSCVLGNHIVLGGQVGVAGHLKIADLVQVGAQSGLMADVDPKKILFGSPARPHREAFKLQALYGRLPELFDAVKQIKKKLGIEDSEA